MSDVPLIIIIFKKHIGIYFWRILQTVNNVGLTILTILYTHIVFTKTHLLKILLHYNSYYTRIHNITNVHGEY